ncbi:MAG TPA: hypothetical protein VG274_04690 [Rhizomicrobium sp.]|nr:hypothetical protein [Rhizomicrobium sp.]
MRQGVTFQLEGGIGMGKVTDLDSVRHHGKPSLIRTPSVPLGTDVRKARAHSYRLRGEELRVIAEDVISPDTARTLLNLAETYDQMASTLDNMQTP